MSSSDTGTDVGNADGDTLESSRTCDTARRRGSGCAACRV